MLCKYGMFFLHLFISYLFWRHELWIPCVISFTNLIIAFSISREYLRFNIYIIAKWNFSHFIHSFSCSYSTMQSFPSISYYFCILISFAIYISLSNKSLFFCLVKQTSKYSYRYHEIEKYLKSIVWLMKKSCLAPHFSSFLRKFWIHLSKYVPKR